MQTFDNYLKEFAEKRVGKDRAVSTLENYSRSRRYLTAFLQYEYKLDDIPFKELKRNLIEKYIVYLSTVRGMLPGSIHTPIKKLKLMTYTTFSLFFGQSRERKNYRFTYLSSQPKNSLFHTNEFCGLNT